MTEKTMTLRDTITPKSDQLNYDDLITGPVSVEVTGLAMGNAEQPVVVKIKNIETGEQMRDFKPCKSVRRILIAGWGDKGREWIGRSMTLYADKSVKYAGKEVGGVRVSHLSHIERPLDVLLTVSRGNRAVFTVRPLKIETKGE